MSKSNTLPIIHIVVNYLSALNSFFIDCSTKMNRGPLNIFSLPAITKFRLISGRHFAKEIVHEEKRSCFLVPMLLTLQTPAMCIASPKLGSCSAQQPEPSPVPRLSGDFVDLPKNSFPWHPAGHIFRSSTSSVSKQLLCHPVSQWLLPRSGS